MHTQPPSHSMQPHTISDPPPNFLVSCTTLSLNPSPAFFHTHCLPSDPIRLILVSSDQTTFFQSSTVQSLCARAKSILSLLCLAERSGLFLFTTAFIPTSFKRFRMVCEERGWLVISCSDLVTWTALSALPVPISQSAWRISVSESLEGRPPGDLVR